ncbi:MAG: hypothetical protein R3C12_25790 [Planctomycetaceae bacterium]
MALISAADRLTFPVKQLNDFVPFTWAVSRIFNVAILLAGTLPFVLRPKQTRRRTQAHQLRSVLLFGLLFGLDGLWNYSPVLPEVRNPGGLICRCPYTPSLGSDS